MQYSENNSNDNSIITWSWEGEAFGNMPAQELSGISINLRFPGQYYDSKTNLSHNWNRYYDPSLGRYITSDPIGLDRGMNTYLYAGANPIIFVDLYGLLSDAAQQIIDAAMANNKNSTRDAHSDVLRQRDDNPYDLPLKDAEHYLFARDWTKSTYGAASVPLIPATIGYTAAKVIDRILPGQRLDASRPTWGEIGAGLEGVLDGILDLLPDLGSPEPVSDEIMEDFCKQNLSAPNCQYLCL